MMIILKFKIKIKKHMVRKFTKICICIPPEPGLLTVYYNLCTKVEVALLQ